MDVNIKKDRKRFLIISIAFVLLLVVATVFVYLYFSDSLKSAPTVSVKADNTYDETLYVVTDKDYEPFSYIDENGDYAGLDVELMNEIANRLNMNLDLVLTDWTSANDMLKSGQAQIIMNMETDLITDESGLIASLPTTEKQYVVYGKDTVSSVAELYGKKVASLHQMNGLGLTDIIYIDSYEEIFKGLKDGTYDYAICPIQVGNSFLTKLNMDGFKPSYAVGHVYGALALKSDESELLERINPIINELTKEGFINSLDNKWVNHRYENMSLNGIVNNHPWVGVFLFVVPLLLILLFVYILLQQRNALQKDAYAEALLEAKEHAEASAQAKTTFLSNMSHDLRTPMNAIIGYTNLAKEHTGEPSVIEDYLNKIGVSGEHLLLLINDVLEMSRIENGKLELNEAPCDLLSVMNETEDIFKKQMEEKGLDFSIDTKNVKNRYIVCDKGYVNRILLNLISNAFKFTPKGGSISVRLSETPNEDSKRSVYELRVKDTGIGMTKEFSEKVFDAFERERTSTVSGIQGTGLGMAITKRIVDLMNGTITLNTAPNEGTEFIVNIPFAHSAYDALPESEKSSEKKTAPDTERFKGKRLLLVEDNDINREIANKILTGSGFIVESAVNGQEAVDKVSQNAPDYYNAVLMDIQMPVMNGYEAARAIRALDTPVSNVPIIAMTANAFAEDRELALSAGMNAHISKPINISVMLKTLSEFI